MMEIISQIAPSDDRWWLKALALSSLKRRAGFCKVDAQRLLDVISGLEAENARLREALEWYADQKNYSLEHAPIESGMYSGKIFHVPDCGERARKALERKE